MFKSSTFGVQIVFALSLLMAAIGFYTYGFTLQTVGLSLLGYFIYGCLGIVVTFHRLLTHRSYKTSIWLERLFTFFGCMGNTGSSLAWVAIHFNHHLNSDKEGDPHSPHQKGLKVFNLDYENEVKPETKWRMRELITNPFHQFVHRYYFLIMAVWALLLYTVGGFYLVVFLFFAPAFLTGVMSNVVNYVGHKPNWIGGFRTYNLNDKSANNWLFAVPTWGEAWHNNHHRFPTRFSCGQKWWQIDISAYVIRLIKT